MGLLDLFEERFRLSDDMQVFIACARLRRSAVSTDIQQLRERHQPIGIEKGLTHKHAWRAAVALLQFDFNYGARSSSVDGGPVH
jgi:hypothetical protein